VQGGEFNPEGLKNLAARSNVLQLACCLVHPVCAAELSRLDRPGTWLMAAVKVSHIESMQNARPKPPLPPSQNVH
jgi:hypothetical protein